MTLNGAKLTWLGHSTFLVTTPQGGKILVDPWLAGNPACPKAFHDLSTDAILVTHGHGDHIGDLITAAERCTGPIACMYELAKWLASKGVPEAKLLPMNKGGTAHLTEIDTWVAMTDARHSSAWIGADGTATYLGEAAGWGVRMSNDLKLYFAGDTCAFNDMSLIAELLSPDVAILPIGDRYTMGPRGAAIAARLLKVKTVIPCHYGTYPLLTGTVEELKRHLQNNRSGLDHVVVAPKPGETLS